MSQVLVFCPTSQLEPEAVDTIFTQTFDRGYDVMFTRHNPHATKRENIRYHYQRGRQAALDGGYEAMWCAESDMVFPTNALRELWDTDADVALGLYVFRRAHTTTNAQLPDGSFVPVDQIDDMPEVFPVIGNGFGCTLIRRHVLEAVPIREGPAGADWVFYEDAAPQFRVVMNRRVICGHKTPQHTILTPCEEQTRVQMGETWGWHMEGIDE